MVNKPHAPRQANKTNKKAPVAATANGEDTSYIVFGNEKPGKKGKQPASRAESPAAAGGSKSRTPAAGGAATAQPEAEKKPDTRTLIAGASWTGKLPMTLFNEHCQKQRWEKPEYTMQRTGNGFTGGVILRQKNTKTQEITQLPAITPPSDYNKERAVQPSAVEARHFAAAYALFRVSNMKNIHMMLPPQYRDLWKGDFQDLKSEAVANGQGYLYEADPFLAKKQHDEANVAKDKARADRTKQQEEEKKHQVVSLDGQVQSRHVLKGWMRVPKVEMGTKSRRETERLIRIEGVWNPNGIRLSKQQSKLICDDLSSIGFRRSHAEEATEICKDREECLEWLLIHVPEDDLPKWTLPENYLAGVSLASGDLKREGKLKRLSAGGYSMEVCADVLDSVNGDESKAAAGLQELLLDDVEVPSVSDDAGANAWDEELSTLEAIFGDRLTNHDRICTMMLELQTPDRKPITLRARPPSLGYPNTLPVLSVEAELPAYIRLSILKRCLAHAKDNLMGEQMMFSIVDWLENEIPSVIEHPGRLSEIASAASTSAEAAAHRTKVTKTARRQPRPIHWAPNSQQSQRLLADFGAKQATPAQQKMSQARQTLPAWKLQDAIVQAVTSNQVTIISGETGSGKSTQSVQFILDDLIRRTFGEQANIICTQPRRISALGLADRVADERCGRVGDEVGYAIRGESKQKQGTTKITFVTTGVLLRRLQTSGGSADDVVRSLADVSHVVIDEVHERSLDTDFLLILMRDVLKKRKDLKLVLMSATLDAAVFEQYFSGSSTVGKVEIEGRTYPVQDVYLDEIVQATGFGGGELEGDDGTADDFVDRDPRSGPKQHTTSIGGALRAVGTRINYDLIAQTVQHISMELGRADGGILIFLSGVAEIDQTLRALRNVPGLWALPLHASLQSSEQRLVFKKPPSGMRKVVAATNVAETSITIEDIVAVVDTGRVKETSFDPANSMVKLAEVWASRAACKQRRGRAGRVRAGKCYKLYTRAAEAKMAERPDPEIRRVPLEQLCLSVKAMGVTDVPAFLASALTPPESLAVEGALKLLSRMGALDDNEMTALGRHLSMIPADLRCGKLLVYGAAFGCLDACLTIAAILTVKSPFVSPQAKREESKAARAAFGKNQGDLLCDLHAYEEWSAKRASGEPTSSIRRWCDENFLNHQTLMDISTNRTQYASSLQEIGFLPPGAHSRARDQSPTRSDSTTLLRALLAAAVQPQLARIDFPDTKFAASSSGAVALDPEARTIKFFTETHGRVFLHPSSTLFAAQTFPAGSAYMSYFAQMSTSKVFVREVTPCNVFGALMFGGPIAIDAQGRGLLVDGWLRLRGWARIGVLVSRMRGMLDAVLARKVEAPGEDVSGSAVVRLVRGLVERDGLDRRQNEQHGGLFQPPPGVTLDLQPFTAHVSDEKLQHFQDLLKLSLIGPATFENTATGRKFGTQRDWLTHAKDYWLHTFDWRQHEARFNSYPQFTAHVQDEAGNDLTIHFLALFSQRKDAVPLAFFHGWPGSFVEFLDLLDLLRTQYPDPKDLPYHVVVPSLPGYAYSSGPPLDVDYSTELAASALHNLLCGLGFGASGYLAQGGDIGSFVARILASRYDECRGMHVNMIAGPPPPNKDSLPLEEIEQAGLARGAQFFDTGFAYALEHGTRTATIGLALSASPLALLSWIGEKFLEWTDADPPLDKILEDVTLYWLTETLPRCIYPYRGNGPKEGETPKMAHATAIMSRTGRAAPPFVNKPCGYSFFPKELFPAPKSWVEQGMDLVAFGRHESGGHFAAMEKPKELLADVEEWVGKAWKPVSGKL